MMDATSVIGRMVHCLYLLLTLALYAFIYFHRRTKPPSSRARRLRPCQLTSINNRLDTASSRHSNKRPTLSKCSSSRGSRPRNRSAVMPWSGNLPLLADALVGLNLLDFAKPRSVLSVWLTPFGNRLAVMDPQHWYLSGRKSRTCAMCLMVWMTDILDEELHWFLVRHFGFCSAGALSCVWGSWPRVYMHFRVLRWM